jgi:hypothetical protein
MIEMDGTSGIVKKITEQFQPEQKPLNTPKQII